MRRTKKYVLTVLSIIVTMSLLLSPNVLANNNVFTFTFKFQEFLTSTTGEYSAENILNFNTPREITINAPKKVIEQVEVLHKKGKALAEEDVSITNIDIITVGEEVAFINVTINGVVRTIMEPFEIDGNKKTFSIGYAKLNDNFDVEIDVRSAANETLELMKFKVPEGSSDIFKINEKFTYKTAGKKYSLYELLANQGLFVDLLVEHDLKDIDAEYVD